MMVKVTLLLIFQVKNIYYKIKKGVINLKNIENIINEMRELRSQGWSYTKIAEKFNLKINFVRRRLLRKEELKYGENSYYKQKYIIALFDFETKELVGVYKNLKELNKVVNRVDINTTFSRTVSQDKNYIYNGDKSKKYNFVILPKGIKRDKLKWDLL